MERVLLQGQLKAYSTMSQRMVAVQKLSSILEAKIGTKIRAKRWQTFMKSLNLCKNGQYLLSFEKLYETPPSLTCSGWCYCTATTFKFIRDYLSCQLQDNSAQNGVRYNGTSIAHPILWKESSCENS